jgi:hypothetical protein
VETHFDRVMDWGDDIIAAYVRIAKALAMLVLPIELPMHLGKPEFMKDAHAAIVRTLSLIQDQPMGDEVYALLRQSILDWLTALDLVVVHTLSPKAWREDIFAYTIMRCVTEADLALEALTGEPPSDE